MFDLQISLHERQIARRKWGKSVNVKNASVGWMQEILDIFIFKERSQLDLSYMFYTKEEE